MTDMSNHKPRTGWRHAGTAVRLVTLLSIVGLLLSMSGPAANAMTITDSGPCRGGLTWWRVQGQGFQNQTGLEVWGGEVRAQSYPVIQGTHCSTGQQTISLTRRVWWCIASSCSWSLAAKQTWTGKVYPGQNLTFAPTGLRYTNPGIALSVDETITWRNQAGTVVGTRYLNFNSTNDYRCTDHSLTNGYCWVGTDSVMGAVIAEGAPHNPIMN